MSFLVDWWDARLFYERNGRELAHQQKLLSPELLGMYNRPRSVIDLQALYDRVHELMRKR